LPFQLVLLDRDVLALDVAGFGEAPTKRSGAARIGRPPDKSDDRHRRLLRARCERPRGCRAAEQRDELAALHVWMAPAWQEKM
jgi:hypothetical protein